MGKRLALLAIRLLVSVNLLYAAIFLKFAVPGSVTRTNVQEIVGNSWKRGHKILIMVPSAQVHSANAKCDSLTDALTGAGDQRYAPFVGSN